MMRARASLVLALLLAAVARPMRAQGHGFALAHLFSDPSATMYRLDLARPLVGPVTFAPALEILDGSGAMGNLWGGGLDLALFRGGQAGVYLIGGVDGGLITRGDNSFWGSWSAGIGYELFPVGGVSFALEGRYRHVGPGDFGGVQLGARLGLHSGRSSGGGTGASSYRGASAPSNAAPEATEIRNELTSSGVPENRAVLIGNIVQTALDVMGMPYRWGDDGENGFDCSGLIRYAFGKHGITLPRRSVEQAREGTAVEKSIGELRAGDVLTFRTRGKNVSHVGLYLGDRRFIHSASKGVQISILSPDDVAGRWWYTRWVGVRRIVT
jgi:cell wall-associated NlpC family hydrolase